jgi:hypothetical protein
MTDNCAVGSDGKLLDASQIEWQFDPDSSTVPPAYWIPASAPSSSTPNAFDVLLAKRHSPAITVAGQRRSERVKRPTAKVIEGSNTESVKGKRKASPEAPRRTVSRKITESDSDVDMVNDDALSDRAPTDVVTDNDEDDEDDDIEIISYEDMTAISASDVS